MGKPKTLSKKAMAELESAKKSTKKYPPNYAGIFILGSENPLILTHQTPKSVTLEVGRVSLGKHFGKVLREHKPS